MYIGNDFKLKQKRVGVKKNYFISSPDVNNFTAFLLFINIYLSNNKDKKIEGVVTSSELKLALTIYFIKDFIYKIIKTIAQKVNSWFYGRYF